MGRLLGNSAQHTWCAKYLHIMYKCCFVFEICSVQKSTCTVPASPNVNMGSSKENPSQAHLTSSLSRKRAFCLTFKVLRMLPTGPQTSDRGQNISDTELSFLVVDETSPSYAHHDTYYAILMLSGKYLSITCFPVWTNGQRFVRR